MKPKSSLKYPQYVDGWSLAFVALRLKLIMTGDIKKKLNPNSRRPWRSREEIREGITAKVDHWERAVRDLKWPTYSDDPPSDDPPLAPGALWDIPALLQKGKDSKNKESKLLKRIDPVVWSVGTSAADWKVLANKPDLLVQRCTTDCRMLKRYMRGRKRSDLRGK